MFIPLSCVKTIWRCWRVFLKNDTPRKKRQFLIEMGNIVWCCNYILYNYYFMSCFFENNRHFFSCGSVVMCVVFFKIFLVCIFSRSCADVKRIKIVSKKIGLFLRKFFARLRM